MVVATHWRAWVRYLVAAGSAMAISWFAFGANRPVPVFDWIDLGVHELGHVVTAPFPPLFTAMAGSLLQVLVPASLALYFWLRQRDAAGVGFCMAWAGTSAWDVSVYIADAPVQALPLIGGGQHDWAYILGPQQFDALDRAGSIAGFVETVGLLAAVAGIGIALAPAGGHLFGKTSRTEKPRPARETRAPVPSRRATRHAVGDPWLAAANLPFFSDEARSDEG